MDTSQGMFRRLRRALSPHFGAKQNAARAVADLAAYPTLTHGLSGDALAARAARGVARQALAGCNKTDVEVAELLVSELVTNAVVHTGSEPVMRIDVNRGGIRVEVHDRSPQVLQMIPRSATAETGRGLQLVDELSAGWGFARTGQGKFVWFEL